MSPFLRYQLSNQREPVFPNRRTGRVYRSLAFVNEHSFAVLSDELPRRGGDPRLHIFDTGQGTALGDGPVQTSFLFPINRRERIGTPLRTFSEPCGHAPLPDELLLEPFYQDPFQRIFALHAGRYLFDVINTEVLLELARKREGQEVGWDEWGGSISHGSKSEISTNAFGSLGVDYFVSRPQWMIRANLYLIWICMT